MDKATPASHRKRRSLGAFQSAENSPAPRSARKNRRKSGAEREKEETPLLSLPPELHRQLFQFVPLLDLYTLSKSCRAMRLSSMLLDAVKSRVPFLLPDIARLRGLEYEELFGKLKVPPNKYFDLGLNLLDHHEHGDHDHGDHDSDAENETTEAQPQMDQVSTANQPVQPEKEPEPDSSSAAEALPPPTPAQLNTLYSALSVFLSRFLAPALRKAKRLQGRTLAERLIACALSNIIYTESPEDIPPERFQKILYALPSRFEELGRLLSSHTTLSPLVILDLLDASHLCWIEEQESLTNHTHGWPFTFLAPLFRSMPFLHDKYAMRRFLEGLWTMAHDQMPSAHEVLDHVAAFLVEMKPSKKETKYAIEKFHSDGVVEEIRRIWRTRLYHAVFPDEKEKAEQRARDLAAGLEVPPESETENSSEDEDAYDVEGDSNSSGTFSEMDEFDDWSGSEFSDSDPSDDGMDDDGMDDLPVLGPYLDQTQHHDPHPAAEGLASEGQEEEEDARSWVTESGSGEDMEE